MTRQPSPSRQSAYCKIVGGLLLALILADRIAALVLPPSAQYYRAWEYMMGAHRYGQARTEQSITMGEVGDLGNMLGAPEYAEPRQSTFSLDERGHRNPPMQRYSDPDVFIVGNSFIAGAGNDDNELLTVQVERATDRRIRAYAPADISLLLRDREMTLPPLVVWGRVERNLTAHDPLIENILRDTTCFAPEETAMRIDRIKTIVKRIIGPPLEYAKLSLTGRIAQRLYREGRFRLTGEHDPAVTVGAAPLPMLFFTKDVNLLKRDAQSRDIAATARAIAHVSDCLAARGARMVFVPIPDKSHVYRKWVPGAPPAPLDDPLDALARTLEEADIPVIELWPVYRDHAAGTDAPLLYWRDDTHWNAAGIALAADAIVDWIEVNDVR